MQINERFIKPGKLPVSISMELGAAIQVQIPGEDNAYQLECTKIERKDNGDGTYDEIYVLKHFPT